MRLYCKGIRNVWEDYLAEATLRYALSAAQLLKNETLKITYSYWDGQGHRRVATVKKGDTVKDFLQKVKEQLIPEFRELRYMTSPSKFKQHC